MKKMFLMAVMAAMAVSVSFGAWDKQACEAGCINASAREMSNCGIDQKCKYATSISERECLNKCKNFE